MKTRILMSGILLVGAALAPAATNDLTATLQKGLFEEEANHNIGAAIQAYQAVINQFDKDRKLAATAVFRLAECYRKQGATNEAAAQYERVLREFPDQTPLVISTRQNLTLLGVAPGQSPAPVVDAGSEEPREIGRIQELLKDSPDLINAPGKNGETLLQAAAAKGQFSVVAALINLGADVNVNRPYNISPLHYAAGNGHKSVVDLLIQHGAKLDAQTDSGVMPLHLAAAKSYTLVAKALIDAGAPVNARVRQSVSRGRSEGDLEYGFAGGESPLDLAIANNSQEIVSFLVAAKADLKSGSPLLNAAGRGEKSIVELLLDHGADVGAADSNGNTALHLAAQSGNQDLVNLLLTRKADINSRNRAGASPLHTAAAAGNGPVVEALLAKGADMNPQDDLGSTPLRYAVNQDKTEVVGLLLAHKADPNIKDSEGFTPLHISVSRGDARIVRSLLDAGADTNSKNNEGGTPLILAADRSNLDILALLLDHNVNVDTPAGSGKTALMIAAERLDKGAMELLLAHKANPNARDFHGNSALHFLEHFGNRPGMILPPLQRLPGALSGVRSEPNSAVRSQMAELLLAAGADVNAQNNEGKTPLQLVKENRFNDSAQADLAAILRKHGAQENPPDFSSIRIMRKGLGEPTVVFRSDTNGLNRFSLLEVLFGSLDLTSPGQQQCRLPFPDLSRITISRYTTGNPTQRQEISVNVLNSANGIDCSKDIPLQFGDQIEIPEREHTLSEPLVGLTMDQWSDLTACLKRKVTFIVKGQTKEITTGPTLLSAALGFPAIQSVLRSSSDLCHIHLRRTDPVTGAVKELVLNEQNSTSLRPNGVFSPPGNLPVFSPPKPVPGQNFPSQNAAAPDNLWLRDGDVIEVPDKP